MSAARRRSRSRRVWILLFAAVALAGHYLSWYLPRLRSSYAASELVASVADDSSYDLSVWLPFPHQTLPAVGERVGIDREVASAALGLVGWRGSLPSRLPPARELAASVDLDASRGTVALRLYPSAAAFARLAGMLSSSPWLRQGEFLRDDDLYRITWSGATWRVDWLRRSRLSDASPPPGPPPSANPSLATPRGPEFEPLAEPTLGRLIVRRAPRGGPTGHFTLRVSPRAVEVGPEVGRGALAARPAPDLLAAGAVALALDGVPPRALAIFPGGPGAAELPRTAEAHREGAPPWRLPTDTLLRATGRRPRSVERGPWSLSAARSTELAALDLLLPRIMMQQRGVRGVWIELPAAADEVERLADGLGASPLLTRHERDRLAAASTVFRGLATSCRRIEVRSTPTGSWAVCERLGES